MITGSALTPLRESVAALPVYRAGHPAARQVPLGSALKGGVKGHNTTIREVPYREVTPFRALSFTCP
jgi:hypothetical protein